jgi:hypothetical protein
MTQNGAKILIPFVHWKGKNKECNSKMLNKPVRQRIAK